MAGFNMRPLRVIVVGGGAAGFFAAITCAEASKGTEVTVLEKGARFLGKVAHFRRRPLQRHQRAV